MSLPGNEASQVTEQLLLRARGGERSALAALFASAGDRVQLFVELRMGPRLRAEVAARGHWRSGTDSLPRGGAIPR